jgi:hypothetical protein
VSSPVTAAAPRGGTLARQFTEPWRELSVLALLAGNAVFLFLGFSSLFFVIDRWASDFGVRSALVFPTFVGPISLGLPIAALLLATHVAPMLRRTRLILIAVVSELGVSAVFGALTFLGAFAHDLPSPRAILEGTLWRIVWLGFLGLACWVTSRLWLGLYPLPKPGTGSYGTRARPAYGQPYPGQPLYPQPAPDLADSTPVTGWPLVPPPPMPEPLVLPTAEPTVRISRATIESSGVPTQKVPPLPEETEIPTGPDAPGVFAGEMPTQQIER